MRLIVYATFLICCALVQTSLAENKNYKKSRDNEDNSVERPSKYKGDKKYKAKYRSVDNDSEEDYKVNKHRNKKPWEEEHDFATEKKHSKYTKKANRFVESEEEPLYNKKNRRDKDSEGSGRRFGKKKSFISEEDSDEDFAETKTQIKRDNKDKLKINKRKLEEEKITKTTKYPTKHAYADNDDEDDSEEIVKFEKKIVRKTEKPVEDSDETEEEAPKQKFRRKIRVRIPNSSEEESKEDYRDICERKFKKGKLLENCLAEESANGNGETNEPVRSKKIKYSIKFAHEKEKNVPNEENNIILKIHRGENKKYRYQNDDDDDSSEENAFPKRMTFLDDDEE